MIAWLLSFKAEVYISFVALVVSGIALFFTWRQSNYNKRISDIEADRRKDEIEDRKKTELEKKRAYLELTGVYNTYDIKFSITNTGKCLATQVELEFPLEVNTHPIGIVEPGETRIFPMLYILEVGASARLVWTDEEGRKQRTFRVIRTGSNRVLQIAEYTPITETKYIPNKKETPV